MIGHADAMLDEAAGGARDELTAGTKHLFESELKDKRRTPGRRGHERRPAPGA